MHLALILDGNRRWAQQRGKLAAFGHQAGFDNFMQIVQHCAQKQPQIKTLSAYALSTENLQRSKFELDNLFRIFSKMVQQHGSALRESGVRVVLVGNLTLLPAGVRDDLQQLAADTANGDKLLLQLCIAYGGRDELARAAANAAQPITADTLAAALDSAAGGAVDLLVRTGGKQRLSNFLLWQVAYAELYFTDKLWPEFDAEQLQVALDWHASVAKNFGK